LDRDGTIIVERDYLSNPLQIEFLPGAVRGLRLLLEMGLGLVVVTNQSAVGRGFFDEAQLDLVHRQLRELLKAEGVQLEGIYFCPLPKMVAHAASPTRALSSEQPTSLILTFKQVSSLAISLPILKWGGK
jgi:D-glycero-D-manno-heptose 1,7-bisphosphate phosphatase